MGAPETASSNDAADAAATTESPPLLLASLEEAEDRAIGEALPARPKLRARSQRLLTGILEEQSVALVVLGHELGGPPLLRELRGAELQAPVLYIAPEGRADLEQAVLEAGADGFVVRPVPAWRLVLHIQCLDRRRGPSGIVTALRSGALDIDVPGRTATLSGRPLVLTTARFNLLVHLLRHRHRVIPAAELVRVALAQPNGAPKNVRYHITYLRRDLDEYGLYIEAVRGVGYRWAGPP